MMVRNPGRLRHWHKDGAMPRNRYRTRLAQMHQTKKGSFKDFPGVMHLRTEERLQARGKHLDKKQTHTQIIINNIGRRQVVLLKVFLRLAV
jgi:hypothetical protein